MATDRQLRILQHLAIQDETTIPDLSELLHVSPSTVRRELSVMENNGLLVRTHGGAHLPTPVHYAVPYEKRAAQQIEEKRMIALAARKLVKSGTVIGIMGGTTCTELARVLRPIEQLTIVTNALNVALEFQGPLSRRVVVTGGMLNQNSYELIGSQAVQSLECVHLDLMFLGVSGISLDYGFCMSDEPEAAVGRAFIAAADRAVVVADHTKFDHVTFARLCPLNSLSLLVTDKYVEPGQKRAVEHTGLRMLVADGSV
jgi:DeoR family transcriptional regulator of aga operon